jgi:cyanophycinase-like exopeptidase
MLVLIGSGEMRPQMARVHRSVMSRLAVERAPGEAVRAAVVDTPYGFQENAATLSEEALDFFGRRLGMDAQLAALPRGDLEPVAREKAYATIRASDFVFSGPGSPSYALGQWTATDIPTLFVDKLLNGGALVMASAAALTLGRLTAPIYEIYKAGEDPRWLRGLDVLSAIGISAAVIPHWDNMEGAAHDTRYCFLGQRRFEALERSLPDDVFVLGIDEHTALVLDLDAGIASVRGRGAVTVRKHGHETLFPAGHDMPLDTLAAVGARLDQKRPSAASSPVITDSNLAARVVALEGTSAKLAERAALVEPLVSELLRLRADARAMGVYPVADGIRARLTALGVEITDESDGTTDFRLP